MTFGAINLCQRVSLLIALGIGLSACEQSKAPEPVSETLGFALPEAISNNAVAVADGPNGPTLYSFNGLKAGKSWQDTSNAAFACVIATESCKAIAPVPVPQKLQILLRLAAGRYAQQADMPTPVDDAVAVPYQNRFVYLVSGWHDEGNVSVVQLFDTQTGAWTEVTPFPGTPVFGHAGGIAGNSMIISDGVASVFADGKRKFVAAKLSWRGDIDPQNPTQITWRSVDAHAGPARYRMAAIGDEAGQRIIFAGGGDNPYNYDGIGYDGVPAKPSGGFFAYDLKSDKWVEHGRLAEPSMDHRALGKVGQHYYIVGGMDAEQQILSRIVRFRIPD